MKRWRNIAAVCAAVCLLGSSGTEIAAQETEVATEIEKTAEIDGQVASADEMAKPEEIVEDWMTPIKAGELVDGVYPIEVRSSSSMFRIESCELTVKEGKMSAVMTMGGTGYLYLYMGTGAEAVEAKEDQYLPFQETKKGEHTFEVPVEALDQGIHCAAFSKRKEKWYDRVLVFLSTSLPQDALKEKKMTTAEDLKLEDGAYQAEAILSGGSGRTTIESPAELTVKDGVITAKVVFSSPHYDYMLVNEKKYEPVNTEGNSAFEIPIAGFDYQMPVIADTIAMSQPYEIDYTIWFDSATLEKVE